MEYTVTIEDLEEMDYIVIPQLLPLHEGSNADELAKAFWTKCDREGTFDRLKAVSKADEIYALFCNTCDTETWMTSYDYACINHAGVDVPGFQRVRLRPAKYAVFSCTGTAPMTMQQAYWRFNDIFWGEWLPKSAYKSIIDYDRQAGSASIELFAPFAPYAEDVSDFSVKVWYPISER